MEARVTDRDAYPRRWASPRDLYPGLTGEELLRAMLAEVYTPEGIEIWLADAKKKGRSLDHQLTTAEQLITGTFI